MSPKKAQRIIDILSVVMLCCLIAVAHVPWSYGGLLVWIIIIIVISIVVLNLKYNRCPKCGTHLNRGSLYPNCPYCGADLNEKPSFDNR